LRKLFILTLFFLCMSAPSFAQQTDDTTAQTLLVRTASIIRGIETQLQNLDTQINTLEVKREGLEKDYTTRRARIASSLSALTRLGRTPREAVLIRPGGPLQAARTSMLLSGSLPVVEAEAQSFKTLLTDLAKTKAQLSEQSAKAKAARDTLKTKHAELEKLFRARNSQGIQTPQDAQKIRALAQAARNLQSFLNALDTPQPQKNMQQQSIPESGNGIMPVSGIVRVSYGQLDPTGTKSSGISIETLAGSLVIAPLGGIIKYTGDFRGYGQIIIIEHQGGYYSLLAGVDKITVSEGQAIVSGEPIAILGDDSDANQAVSSMRKTLYYELRRGGQPVNPSRKLPSLG
jgi:septal ring factor EnvC (AmiA/AmiB activator)